MDEAPSVDQAETTFVPAAVPASTSVQPVPEPIRSALGDRWVEVVAVLQGAGVLGALVRELAMQAQLLAIEPVDGHSLWRLQVERDTLRNPALVDKLQAWLVEHVDGAIRLEVQPGIAADTPALREVAAAARRQREAEAVIQADPLVLALRAQFSSARLVPGSIRPD
jgi:DNA polymerase-3 subunit gamma/tau